MVDGRAAGPDRLRGIKELVVTWLFTMVVIAGDYCKAAYRSPAARRHAPAMLGYLLIVLFTGRHIFFSSEIPAGTDMFGWLARPEFLARNGEGLSIWTGAQLGATRQINLETIMSEVVAVIHSPIVTLRLFLFIGMVLAPVAMYIAMWSWFGSRFAAFIAGAVFLTTQYFVGQWTSGHMNLAMMYSLGPLFVLTFDHMVVRRTVNSAIVFAVVAAALVVVSRVDALLYLGPAALAVLAVRLPFSKMTRQDLKRLGISAGIAGVVFAGLSSPVWVPIALGAGPDYAGGNPNLDSSLEHHLTHSFPPLETALGQARELGYLGTMAGYSWNSEHPFLWPRLYDQIRMIIFVGAILALIFLPRRTTLILGLILFGGLFLAKGPHWPGESLYTAFYDHVPLFESLRVPNRWLMLSSIGLAGLVGIGASSLAYSVSQKARRWLDQWEPKIATYSRTHFAVQVALALMIGLIISFPVWYVFQKGFLTWQPPDEISADLRDASDERGRLLTSPFGQQWMQVAALPGFTDDQSWIEHDLGGDSGYFHAQPVVGPTSDLASDAYVDFLNEVMLLNATDSMGDLISVADVDRVIALPYRPTTTLPPGRDSDWEVEFINSQSDLVPTGSAGSSLTYDVQPDLPKAFVPARTWAVVGGFSSLTGIAGLPGSRLGDNNTVPLHQILERNGPDGVRSAIERADSLLFADTALSDLAMMIVESPDDLELATPGAGVLSSAASGWSLSDVARRSGMLTLNDFTLSGQGALELAIPFSVDGQGERELWVRLHQRSSSSTVRFSIDGQQVGQVNPHSFGSGYGSMGWVRAGTVSARGNMTLDVETVGSGPVDIDVIRLLEPGEYDAAVAEASDLVRSKTTAWVLEAERLAGLSVVEYQAHSISHDSTASWGQAVRRAGDAPLTLPGSMALENSQAWYRAKLTTGEEIIALPATDSFSPPSSSDPFGVKGLEPLSVVEPEWRSDSPEHTALSDLSDGATLVAPRSLPRPRFTVAQAIFDEPQDISDGRSLLLRFDAIRNSDPSNIWEFIITSADAQDDFAIYQLDQSDIASGEVLIDLDEPVRTSGVVDWSAITRFRIATAKEWNGDLVIGSASVFDIGEPDPRDWDWIPGGELIGGAETGDVELWLMGESTLDQLVLISSPEGPVELGEAFSSGDNSSFVSAIYRKSPTKYEVHVESDAPFRLVFSESFHSLWEASSSAGEYDLEPAYGFLNSFNVDQAGAQVITIEFKGQSTVTIAGWLFLVTVLSLLFYLAYRYGAPGGMSIYNRWHLFAVALLGIAIVLLIWDWRSANYLAG